MFAKLFLERKIINIPPPIKFSYKLQSFTMTAVPYSWKKLARSSRGSQIFDRNNSFGPQVTLHSLKYQEKI